MNTKIDLQNTLNKLNIYINNPDIDPIIMKKIQSLYLVINTSITNNISIRLSCLYHDVSKTSFYRWLSLFNNSIKLLKNTSTRPHNLNTHYTWDVIDKYVSSLLSNTKRHYRINLPTITYKVNSKFNLNISIPTIYKRYKNRVYKKRKKKRKFNSRYEVTELGHLQIDGVNINNSNLINKDGTKFHVFTAIDQYSRLAFAFCYDEKSRFNATDFANKAINFYKNNGITVKHVRTDNGSEFVHTRARWIGNSQHRIVSSFEINLSRQFITYDTTKPSTPQHNGKVERFNRTFKLDCINYLEQTKSNLSTTEINKRINTYIKFYNNEKYHNTLKKTPIEVLTNYLQYGELNEHIRSK